MEILVVDGMSKDGTREKINSILKKCNSSCSVKVLDNPSLVVPHALNIGLKNVKGEIIVRVDGHCKLAPDYFRRCVSALKNTGAECVGGLQRSQGKGWIGRAIASAMGSPFGVGNGLFHYARRPCWTDTVYLGAYPKETFGRIGGFDEGLLYDQDEELNFRIIQDGGKVYLDPAIKSIYYCRSSLQGLWRQHFRYGFEKVRVIQKRRALLSWRHLVPALFLFALMGSILLTVFTRRLIFIYTLIIPYVLADIVFSVWSERGDWKRALLLSFIFPVLHLAYGAGFIYGLWRWRGLWRKGAEAGPGLFRKI